MMKSGRVRLFRVTSTGALRAFVAAVVVARSLACALSICAPIGRRALRLGIPLLLVASSNSVVAGTLVWTGCGIAKKAYMAELARAFEQKTGVHIDLSGGGAAKGIRSVAVGEIQMGGSCRPQLRDRKGHIDPREADARLHMVAWDAIVVITHRSNPVSNITMEALRKIFEGKITNWKDLGGDDRPLKVVARSDVDSGVGYMFRRYVFNDPDYVYPVDADYVKSTGPLEQKVEENPNAIAVDGISSAQRSAVKVLALDGVEPTKENIAAGKYYMFRPLFLTTDAVKPDPNTLHFVEFALSDEGQQIISNTGTVNLQEGAKLNALWEIRKTRLGL